MSVNLPADMRLRNYFDVGEMGIEHALLPEKGLTVAGDVIIGADSHTCTLRRSGGFFYRSRQALIWAAGMATGKAWFKVPSALKFVLTGETGEMGKAGNGHYSSY